MRSLSLLGLAQTAGQLVSGDAAVWEALHRGRIKLLIVASDAAERTKRRFIARACQLGVAYAQTASKAELGQAIGRPDRAVIGVLDQGFARSLIAALPVSGDQI